MKKLMVGVFAMITLTGSNAFGMTMEEVVGMHKNPVAEDCQYNYRLKSAYKRGFKQGVQNKENEFHNQNNGSCNSFMNNFSYPHQGAPVSNSSLESFGEIRNNCYLEGIGKGEQSVFQKINNQCTEEAKDFGELDGYRDGVNAGKTFCSKFATPVRPRSFGFSPRYNVERVYDKYRSLSCDSAFEAYVERNCGDWTMTPLKSSVSARGLDAFQIYGNLKGNTCN
jgi:hypothetical protein